MAVVVVPSSSSSDQIPPPPPPPHSSSSNNTPTQSNPLPQSAHPQGDSNHEAVDVSERKPELMESFHCWISKSRAPKPLDSGIPFLLSRIISQGGFGTYSLQRYCCSRPLIQCLTDKLGHCQAKLTDLDTDNTEKYKKYEADYVRRIKAKYFSKKNLYGGNIFENETTIENEVIKSSRWPSTRSYTDPVQSFEDHSRSSSTSAAETSANLSSRKYQSKKSSS